MTNTFSFNLGFDKPWKRTKRCDGQHKYFAKLAEYKAERQTTAYEEEKAIPDVNPSSYLSRETANSVNLVFSFPTNDKRVTTKSIRWTMDFVFALEEVDSTEHFIKYEFSDGFVTGAWIDFVDLWVRGVAFGPSRVVREDDVRWYTCLWALRCANTCVAVIDAK